jgi:serine/threonine-protein phosphatase 2B catalytic subunit
MDTKDTTTPTDNKDSTPGVIPPPTSDRVVKDVPAPISHKLEHDVLFKQDGTVDLAALQKHLYGEGKLTLQDIEEIISRATEILSKEPTLLPVEAPITGILVMHV